MSFLIDTDICSGHLRGVSHVTSRFLQYTGRLHMSVVVQAELKTWIYRQNTPARFVAGFNAMMREFVVLPVDETVADTFGRLGAEFVDRGTPMGAADLLIAATALNHRLTLVTHNTRDFTRVPGLNVVDWLVP